MNIYQQLARAEWQHNQEPEYNYDEDIPVFNYDEDEEITLENCYKVVKEKTEELCLDV